MNNPLAHLTSKLVTREVCNRLISALLLRDLFLGIVVRINMFYHALCLHPWGHDSRLNSFLTQAFG
jgi:hypothetical protein